MRQVSYQHYMEVLAMRMLASHNLTALSDFCAFASAVTCPVWRMNRHSRLGLADACSMAACLLLLFVPELTVREQV